MSTVYAIVSDYSTIFDNLTAQIKPDSLDVGNKHIIIKVNLCDARPPETGAITHPAFLNAVLRYLRESCGYDQEIFVVESDGSRVLADLYVKWFGLLPIIVKWNAKWLNLSKCETVTKKVDGLYFDEIKVPIIFDDSYFITLPKMKTHILTKVTCGLKNQHGCLHTSRRDRFHSRIDDVIVDENLVMRPDFCMADGIISMGGCQGPAMGVPIYSRIVLVGQDVVAVDAVCAKVMGFRPSSVGHIRKASQKGIGSLRYECVGVDLGELDIDFRWSRVEKLMFRVGMFVSGMRKAG